MINPRHAFLLLIGDDGAILLPPQNRANEAALYAASHHEKDSAPLLDRIAGTPSAPVILLADTLTQSYKTEELPRLSFFDRRKLIARRLEQGFAKAALKASHIMRHNQVLLTALETKGAIDLWRERLTKLPNPSGACGLLPLECADMIETLLPECKNGWGLLVVAQKTGGMRQIVTHDGAFVFTRLTPPLPPTANDQAHAATLALDIKATRDYLARLGLNADTAFHMAAILPHALHKALAASPLDITTCRMFTPHEAAVSLQLSSAPARQETMADLDMMLWVASKRKLRVALMSDDLRAHIKQATIRKAGLAVAASVMLFTLIFCGVETHALLNQQDQITSTQRQVAVLESELRKAQATLAPAAEPLGRLRIAAERQRLFSQPNSAIFELLLPITKALGTQARVDGLHWHDGTLTLDVKVVDEKSYKIDEIREIIKTLHEKLRQALPDSKIENISTLAPELTNGTLASTNEQATTPMTTQFVIMRTTP